MLQLKQNLSNPFNINNRVAVKKIKSFAIIKCYIYFLYE